MQLSPPWRRGQAKPFPSIPRINWTHPLASNLVCYVYDVGGTYFDLVNGGGPGVVTGTAVARGTSAWGNGATFSTTSGFFAMQASLSQFPAQGTTVSVAPWTIASGFHVIAVPQAAGTFALSDTGGNNPFGAAVATSTTIDYITSNGVNDMDNITVPNYLNKYSTVSTVGTSSTSALGYFNGLQVASQSATSNACSYTTPFPTINTLTAGGANFNGVTGQVFWGAIWTRVLTAQENLQLHRDPYGLLIFPEDDIWSTIVGSNAVTYGYLRNKFRPLLRR